MNFYSDVVTEIMTYFNYINKEIKIENLVPPIPFEIRGGENLAGYKTCEMKYVASCLIERLLSFKQKHINPCRRKVLMSRELKNKLKNEEYIHYKQVIEKIALDLHNGVDVNGRLSKFSDRPSKDDVMLLEWNLYHLHLGTDKESPSSKYYQRTGNLLIVYISPNELSAYLVDISEDHHNNVVFSRKKYLEIIDNNWPELLSGYELKGVRLECSVTDEQRQNLRSNGITTMNEINGKTIVNPGIGITAARTGIYHRIKADHVIQRIEQYENACRDMQNKYVPMQIPEYLNYNLKLDTDKWVFNIIEYKPREQPKIIMGINL